MIKDYEKRMKADETREKRTQNENPYRSVQNKDPFLSPKLPFKLRLKVVNQTLGTLIQVVPDMTSEENDFSSLKSIDPIPVALADKSVI